MYMLDTNAIIMAVRHSDRPIREKIRAHLGKDLCISVITYSELEYGIRKSAAPERNRAAITQILLGIQIVDFDASAAAHFGDIFAELERRKQRIGYRVMLIAAHARARGDTVVTNKVKEFTRVAGLRVEDWSADES